MSYFGTLHAPADRIHPRIRKVSTHPRYHYRYRYYTASVY